ncbi:MAG: PBP1A family penicillin-binding protein [Vicinamibacterales bacterium]
MTTPTTPARAPRLSGRLPKRLWRWRWALAVLSVLLLAFVVTFVRYYATFGRMIDARLQGERTRAEPRVFARALELRPGQSLSPAQLSDRLNDLGYAHRARADKPGEFAIGREAIALIPRAGSHGARLMRIVFRRTGRPGSELNALERIEAVPKQRVDRLTLEPPLLTALVNSGREKRRMVPLAQIPKQLVNAVLAIEDRRFYEHPGVDPIRMVGALLSNVFGDRLYSGASTVTQQLARNFFLTDQMAIEQATGQRSLRRKLKEQFMSIVLEGRASKDEILELYLNDVYLGQRGSFAIHGVAEASRLFFGKDVSNVTLAEGAMIAGVIQTARHSPFRDAARAKERRNIVLKAMVEAGYVSDEAAARAAREPVTIALRALDAEAPYFVDYIGQEMQAWRPDLTRGDKPVDVYTTLDLHLQRVAEDAMRAGLPQVDAILARRRRPPAQAALIAADPRTGEILALVGGRSYNQSQFNRAVTARRQPGSVFKPFVYLSAFERAAELSRTDLTPATLVWDEPTEFMFEDQPPYAPGNYEGEYDGEITLRRALALSRNVVAVKVAETTGYDHVASLWKKIGAGTPPRPFPSIALGVFEATPLEIATAFTLFANGGVMRPLRAIEKVADGGKEIAPRQGRTKQIAREDTTFLVTSMMRSVLNEGTGAGARAAGFALDAAGKSGTTNDLRDAWFVGFTPELLTVVWVGLDDNRPVGLSGTQAALPIWTAFMTRALAGRPNRPFEPPAGITLVDIDRDTGRLAQPACPRVYREAFLAGTAPTAACDLHSW